MRNVEIAVAGGGQERQEAPDKQLPAVVVGWDFESQESKVLFDPKVFKTWDMVIAVLETALSEAKFQLSTGRLRNLQAQQMQQLQTEAVRQQLAKAPRH